jgi:pimeloyl-ACP methyl ester carboxylesterase
LALPRPNPNETFPNERPTAGIARVGEVEIFYDTFGEASGKPLLLIMGLGGQMILWPELLCEALAAAGHFVVRFDNRDAGRSSRQVGGPRRGLLGALVRTLVGMPVSVPYTLEDMADDAIGLLDHLGIARAHVWGVSMGGMIGQTLAIRHPSRMLSLISMMSTPSSRIARARPTALRVLLRKRRIDDRDVYADQMVELFRVIGSPGFPFQETAIRQRFGRVHDRGVAMQGTKRQLLAILASGDRTAALRALALPVLVVHGLDDPLIPVIGGRATAAAIPGAELELIEGMGHDLPPALWPRFVEWVSALSTGGSSRGRSTSRPR